ncbi:MAG: pyridoxamine 5'-phosphate oxidase family protein [Bacteroidales bacterium]|nr:pyridoxamine 5'-phosphate oxidase family protein [Bacteroidales bacterium]
MKSRALYLPSELEEIILKCDHCNVAMIDTKGKPYLVPMNFGYHDKVLYLHSGPEGKKLDILHQHPEVCVSFSTDHMLRYQNQSVGCSYSMKYRSVLLHGNVTFITDYNEKEAALHIIMKHYQSEGYRFSEPAVKNVSVFKVVATYTEGRVYGY